MPDDSNAAVQHRLVRAPTRAEAELYLGSIGRGRCGAVMLGARTDDGEFVECVAKFDGRLAMAPAEHLREWLAAEVGRHLSVEVPRSFEIEITREFAANIGDPNIRSLALSSIGSIYGSLVATGVGPPTLDVLPSVEVRLEMAELVAFDVYIHNPDRRVTNPNVLVARRRVVAIDHGDAFSFLLHVFGAPAPAEDALIDMLPNHVFAKTLQGARNIAFDGFRDRVLGLDDAFFGALVTTAPPAWTGGLAAGNVERVASVLRQRRDAIGRWLPQVESWMHK